MLNAIKIRPVQEKDVEKIKTFLLKQLNTLFDTGGKAALTDDVINLVDNYVKPERSQLWLALDDKENVVGTIAAFPYNGRFEIFAGRYDLSKTVEIGRCYIDENYRRKGIGARLLDMVKKFAKEKNYEMLYLHTHHFLPGGFNFWQKNGFAIVFDEGGVYETIHMEQKVQ